MRSPVLNLLVSLGGRENLALPVVKERGLILTGGLAGPNLSPGG